MFKPRHDLNSRRDLEVISSLIRPGDRILDLGCGDGMFLEHLRDERKADVLGMELEPELVCRCIARGIPVVQRDFGRNLDFLDDNSFDMVIVSQTLQETKRPDLVLKEVVRVGKLAAVSTINFAHFSCRLQLLFKGEMPRTSQMPYQWYDTPNIHFSTIDDLRNLCRTLNFEIRQEIPIPARFPLLSSICPNLFAVGGVFVLSKRE